MNENEAKKEIVGYINNDDEISEVACKIAIKALEEIQQYRALGTVEELREAVSFDELNNRIQKALKDEPTAYDIDTVIKELSEAMGVGNSAFMQGYRAALDDVKSYGKPVEHILEI